MSYYEKFGRNTQYMNKIFSAVIDLRENYDQESVELSKSQIQNLPNYIKNPLGNNLPFVVVFQSIEIQRLTNDIESLKVKVKDYENKIFNSGNYQVQIKQLTQRIHEMEKHKVFYLDENQKLKEISKNLYNELEQLRKKFGEIDFTLKDKLESEKIRNHQLSEQNEKWKTRYISLQKAKIKELEDLRLMLQSQRKSSIERQIRQLTLRFNGQRGCLQNQIKKLRQNLQYKNKEIKSINQNYHKLQIIINQYRQLENKLAQYENKIMTLSQQLIRMNDVIRNKMEQTQDWKHKVISLENQLKIKSDLQKDNKLLKESLQCRHREIQQFKIRYSRLEDQIKIAKRLQYQVEEMNGKINILNKENSRLNNILREKIDQLNSQKNNIQRLSQQIYGYRGMQKQFQEFENKIALLTSQIDRLNQLSRQRLRQYQNKQNQNNENKKIIHKLQNQHNQFLQFKQVHKKVLRDNDFLNQKINNLQKQVLKIVYLQKIINNKDGSIDALGKQIDRLNSIVKGKIQQLEDQKIKYKILQKNFIEFKKIEQDVKEYEKKIVLLTQQIQRLNNNYKDKVIQLDNSTKNIYNLKNQLKFYKTYQTKLKQYQNQIQMLHQNLINNDKKYQDLERSYHEAKRIELVKQDLQKKLSYANQQINKLNDVINKKYNEIQNFKAELIRAQHQINKYRKLQITINDLQKKLSFLESENNQIQKQLQSKDVKLYQENKIIQQFSIKIIVLSGELQKTFELLQEKQHQYQQISNQNLKFQKQLYSLQINNKNFQEKIKDDQFLINQLKQTIQNMKKTNEENLQTIQNMKKTNEENLQTITYLQSQLNQYMKYKEQIIILGKEIDRLEGLNKQLESDIKALRLRYSDSEGIIKKNQGFIIITRIYDVFCYVIL